MAEKDSKKYFEYTIKDSSIETVADLLFNEGSFINGFTSPFDFMIYNGDSDISTINLTKILSRYSSEEYETWKDSINYNSFPIKFGTSVLIPFAAIDRDIISLFGDAISSVDTNAFLANALKEFYTNPKNVRSTISKTKSLGSYKEMFNHISVWLWSKSLSVDSDVIINITPFVNNLNTTVGKDGGSFSFGLDPILGVWNDETKKWEIDEKTIKRTNSGEYIAHSHVSDFLRITKTISEQKRKNNSEPWPGRQGCMCAA